MRFDDFTDILHHVLIMIVIYLVGAAIGWSWHPGDWNVWLRAIVMLAFAFKTLTFLQYAFNREDWW